MIVQIYGIRTLEDAKLIHELGGHHIGVSYGHTKRTPGQLTCDEAKEIFDNAPKELVKIGLTVSPYVDEIIEDIKFVEPDVLHLSGDIGDVSVEDILLLRKTFPNLKIMQAIPVMQDDTLENTKVLDYVKEYEDVSDFFLIDTKVVKSTDIGATGKIHSWYIDKAIVDSTDVKCIIAGGLDASNVEEAMNISKPYGVDSFSSTNYDPEPENQKSIKDPKKCKDFIDAALR